MSLIAVIPLGIYEAMVVQTPNVTENAFLGVNVYQRGANRLIVIILE